MFDCGLVVGQVPGGGGGGRLGSLCLLVAGYSVLKAKYGLGLSEKSALKKESTQLQELKR